MVIVDQAPSLKVYDFKEEAVLCDIPLGTLENHKDKFTALFIGHTMCYEFITRLVFNQG